MAKTNIVTLDLNFQGKTQAIASYLIRHPAGGVLIESGPGSTQAALQEGLAENGLTVSDITHVLLNTYPPGSCRSSRVVCQAVYQIYVHPVGAPHMLNPEKLIASATRIYGERMASLWGDFLPVPEEKLTVANDREEIAVGNLRFLPINTPGHAEHHYAYLFEDVCFTGDVGGVRIPGYQYLRVPMPPPELHFDKWRKSIKVLQKEKFARIAPTHFGLYDDPYWQLQTVEKGLGATEQWLEGVMPGDPPIEALRLDFGAWMNEQAQQQGLSPDAVRAYNLANPPGMSADGLQRYWKKVRMAN